MRVLLQAALCACLFVVSACGDTATEPRASIGAAPGKTAIETIAEMTPQNAAPMTARFQNAPRNAQGELEIVTSVADRDVMPTIRRAGDVMCRSMNMTIISTEELPREKGARQILHRCK